jgi:hypothetical protein
MDVLDLAEAKAKLDALNAERERIEKEWLELRSAIHRQENEEPLVGRYFYRDQLSLESESNDDHKWYVWTHVYAYTPERGARAVEYHKPEGGWYEIRLHQRVDRGELGEEISRAEFDAAVQPLLETLKNYEPVRPD